MDVSVIVPVYNVEEYLDKCLNSLVHQTLKNIEIIIVNDGTKDNSEKIIKKYLKKYPNIVYLKKENGGIGSARNEGLKLAKGKYIGYVDSDDYVAIDMFEKMYQKALEDDADVVVCGSYDVIGNKKVINTDPKIFGNINDTIIGRNAVWNKIYKRELILNNNIEFRSKIWYEDLDFKIKVLSNTKKISYVDEPLYYYVNRPGSIMNNSNIDRNLEILICFDEILKYNKKIDKAIIELLAIDHIYISALVRIIRAEGASIKKKEVMNKLISYLKTNFPNFKSNEYIKLLPKNRRIIYHLLNLKMYFLVRLIFKVKEGHHA